MKPVLLDLLRYAVIVCAIVAGIYALILARASALFDQDTPVSVAAAVHLQPHNATYLDRLASWQPDNRKTLLERSVAENPFNYNALIRLGLMAEMQEGDNVAAENWYRRAATVNHMFLPRWTLANFYFRQQRPYEFFHWTKETLELTPYASDPVFAQMWQMTQDEETLESTIPDNPRILLQYAWYLANNKLYDSIPRAVERLVRLVDKRDAAKWGRDDLLAVAEDHMLAAGDLKPALRVWSILNNAGWIEQSVPAEQSPLTNGEFRQPFYHHGFDWKTVENPGCRAEQFSDAAELRISLYGDEAEKLTLAQQYVAIAPGAPYTMKWQIQTDDLVQPSGFEWHLHPVGGSTQELVSGDLVGPNPTWDFVAPADAKTFLLTLEYSRALGTMRARGSMAVKSVAITQR